MKSRRPVWMVGGATLVLLLVLAAWAPFPLCAVQDESGLRVEAAAAYEGAFKYGEWLPVWVSLENAGRDLEAQVQVRVQGSSGSTTYATPVSLPAGSRKRLAVYVLPNNFSRELQVQVVDGQDRVVRAQTVSVKGYPNVTFLTGLIVAERGAMALIPNAQAPHLERPVVLADVALDQLPERIEALRSFDCLVLNDVDTSSLSLEQRTAVDAWVAQGGHLVIGGGAGVRKTVSGLPQELLPLVPREEREVDELAGLATYVGEEPIRVIGPFLLAAGDLGPGRTLAEQDGLPLVRQRAQGLGRVTVVALDLAGTPLDAWAGAVGFWRRLILDDASYSEDLPVDMSPRQMRASQMTYALSSLPSLDLPSVRGLSVMLLVYILAVGPINYLVLRWQKRLHWAWITIPALTLLFAGGAFALGYALRGTDLILNKVVLVAAQPDGSARVDSYVGLFSPARQSYELEVEGSGLLSPIVQEGDPFGIGGTTATGEMTFVQGDPGRVRGLAINQWSMQTFMVEEYWPDLGRVESELGFADGALVGTVRNGTQQKLLDAVLVHDMDYVRLGDLAPGDEVEVRLVPAGDEPQFYGLPLSYRLFEEQLQYNGPTGPSREAQIKQQMLDATLSSGKYSPLSSFRPTGVGNVQGLALIAWLDRAPPDVRVASRQPAQQTTALFYLPLDYDLPESGPVSVPAGYVESRVIQLPSEGGLCGPDGVSVYVGQGEAVFEFALGEALSEVEIDQLTLVLRAEDTGWRQAPKLALYNWPADAWTLLNEPEFGENPITDPAKLISEDGLVRVRLSVDDRSKGLCYMLGMGFEGRRGG